LFKTHHNVATEKAALRRVIGITASCLEFLPKEMHSPSKKLTQNQPKITIPDRSSFPLFGTDNHAR
jgi:hypothetical protein